MDQRSFRRLMGTLSPHEPHEQEMWDVFKKTARRCISPPKDAASRLEIAFHIAFSRHVSNPLRASGEADFYHPFRAAMRTMERQKILRIRDTRSVIAVLLHDSFEDVRFSDMWSAVSHLSGVQVKLGLANAMDIYWLTKQRWRGETSPQYFERMLACESYHSLWAKFEDRIDNVLTLGSMPHENRVKKLEETECYFPRLRDRLEVLLEQEIDSGKLTKYWLKLPQHLYSHLRREIARQKKFLGTH